MRIPAPARNASAPRAERPGPATPSPAAVHARRTGNAKTVMRTPSLPAPATTIARNHAATSWFQPFIFAIGSRKISRRASINSPNASKNWKSRNPYLKKERTTCPLTGTLTIALPRIAGNLSKTWAYGKPSKRGLNALPDSVVTFSATQIVVILLVETQAPEGTMMMGYIPTGTPFNTRASQIGGNASRGVCVRSGFRKIDAPKACGMIGSNAPRSIVMAT